MAGRANVLGVATRPAPRSFISPRKSYRNRGRSRGPTTFEDLHRHQRVSRPWKVKLKKKLNFGGERGIRILDRWEVIQDVPFICNMVFYR